METIFYRDSETLQPVLRNKMFISRQAHEDIQITFYSVIKATKYLLKEGFQFVLTERFCQDVLEGYFGRQRSIGRRNGNPITFQFGFFNFNMKISF